MRGLVLTLALAAVGAFAAAPAQAGVLSQEDAADLAQSLADAQEEQDVCYGWQVTNNFDGTPDVGSSNSGPGAPLVPDRACSRGAIVLTGSIDYACSSCESSDSASIQIQSSGLANPPTVDDLKGLGLKAGALTGDDDDTTLVNMVDALPLIVADRGNAPYVGYEQATTVPSVDHATGKPGSDVMRDSWIWIVLCGLLILVAPLFYFYKRAQRPTPASPSSSSPPPSTWTAPDSSPLPAPATGSSWSAPDVPSPPSPPAPATGPPSPASEPPPPAT